MDPRERLDWLTDELNRHAKLYYEQDSAEIPDWEYDQLFRELQALESAHPDWARADSPTRRVGGAAVAELAPFVHEVPMLSLQNGYRREGEDGLWGGEYQDLLEWERGKPDRVGGLRRQLGEDAPATFALEAHRGWFAAHGVRVGDRVTLASGAPLPAPDPGPEP